MKKPEIGNFLVRTAKVTTKSVTYEIQATGALEALNVYSIDSQVAGTLEAVDFNEGDLVKPTKEELPDGTVKPAKVLAKISPVLYQVQYDRVEAQLKKANADVADAKRRWTNQINKEQVNVNMTKIDYERRVPIQSSGAISNEEMGLFKYKWELAEAQLLDAKQGLVTEVEMLSSQIPVLEAERKQAAENLRKCVVLAPIEGRIESRKATNGQYVTAGVQLAVMADPHPPRLKFTVSEREAPFISPQSTVEFKIAAYPDRKFKATVFRVGDLADSKSRLVTCYAMVDPESTKDSILKSGFFCSVTIQTGIKKEAVVVPMIAILPSELGFVAYVTEDHVAKQRKVKTGLQVSDTEIEIIDGIKAGETLVVEGASSLSNNAKTAEAPFVTPKEAKAPPEIAREDPPKP